MVFPGRLKLPAANLIPEAYLRISLTRRAKRRRFVYGVEL